MRWSWKAHWRHLRRTLHHKWLVLVACAEFKVPFWQAVLHDWHKFTPSEWGPYVRYFYRPDGTPGRSRHDAEFLVAWNSHQKRGRHHWQHWVVIGDNGELKPLPIPSRYVREMVSDWTAVAREFGDLNARSWYLRHCVDMIMHPDTRLKIELLI